MNNYIILKGQEAINGGQFSMCLPVVFENIEEAILYLENYLQYNKINFHLRADIIEIKDFLPEWILKYKLYQVLLEHHEFFIGYYIVEIKSDKEFEEILNKFKNQIILNKELNCSFDIKNNHLIKKNKEIITNHYISLGIDGKPILKYECNDIYNKISSDNEPLKLEEHKQDISKLQDNTNEIPVDSTFTYIKTKQLEYDNYSLWLVDNDFGRFFLKIYDINHPKTSYMIISNEFLFNYFKVILNSPETFYIKKDNYIYRFAKNIFNEKFETLEEIFNSKYNHDPMASDFIVYNSILHYFHIGILNERNLIKYNNNFYIFDIWGCLLLEYVNYHQKINNITNSERILLNKLQNQDIIKIKDLVQLKLKNCFDINTLEMVLNDCIKAVNETINYVLSKE